MSKARELKNLIEQSKDVQFKIGDKVRLVRKVASIPAGAKGVVTGNDVTNPDRVSVSFFRSDDPVPYNTYIYKSDLEKY